MMARERPEAETRAKPGRQRYAWVVTRPNASTTARLARVASGVILCLLFGASAAAAPPAGEPGAPEPGVPAPTAAPAPSTTGEPAAPATCTPPCRTGYSCKAGRCVSLCNPPCGAGEVCVRGECEMRAAYIKRKKRAADRHSYFGVSGGYRVAMKSDAASLADFRIEYGSRYGSMQIGPSFGDGQVAIRTAILGQVPIRLSKTVPIFIAPAVSIGWTYAWLDDTLSTNLQDFFVTPAVRLIYNPHPRISLRADLIQVEVTFLRIASDDSEAAHRVKVVPLQWGLSFGIYFLY